MSIYFVNIKITAGLFLPYEFTFTQEKWIKKQKAYICLQMNYVQTYIYICTDIYIFRTKDYHHIFISLSSLVAENIQSVSLYNT